jgi:hypothetical protein
MIGMMNIKLLVTVIVLLDATAGTTESRINQIRSTQCFLRCNISRSVPSMKRPYSIFVKSGTDGCAKRRLSSVGLKKNVGDI